MLDTLYIARDLYNLYVTLFEQSWIILIDFQTFEIETKQYKRY